MPSLKNRDVARILEQLAPLELAQSYDNVGLIVGEAWREVRGVLTALDVTTDVLKEALALQCNLIVAHHPIWFHSRKKLTGTDFAAEVILFAIRNGISIYSCHTNLDNIRTGVNAVIAERLKLQEIAFLKPCQQYLSLQSKANRQLETNQLSGVDGSLKADELETGEQPEELKKEAIFCQAGSGMIGKLASPLSQRDFLELVKQEFHCHIIRYTKSAITEIEKVALCGGAGSFLLSAALEQGANAFVSADFSYHTFFDAGSQLLCLDIGHYESEQFTVHLLAEHLHKELPKLAVHCTKINTNPVNYYI